MKSQAFTQWFESLPSTKQLRALALIYSSLTIHTRQLFLPDVAKGNEEVVVKALQGINELHHTVANQIVASLHNDQTLSPPQFSQQLNTIADSYQLGSLLSTAIEFVRTQTWQAPEP